MLAQRQRDTAPELAVRGLLTSFGIRYRVAARNLPGRPDVSNRSRGWVIFVHGCFWHGHPGCTRATLPKRNRSFWRIKIATNRARDERKASELRLLGMKVFEIWECETSDPNVLRKKLTRLCRLHFTGTRT